MFEKEESRKRFGSARAGHSLPVPPTRSSPRASHGGHWRDLLLDVQSTLALLSLVAKPVKHIWQDTCAFIHNVQKELTGFARHDENSFSKSLRWWKLCFLELAGSNFCVVVV